MTIAEINTTPRNILLSQNYPNPFNTATTIEFESRVSGWMRLDIYDLLDRSIATLVARGMEAGGHRITWDSKDVSSGDYFYRLSSGGFEQTKKMLLIK